MRQPQPARFADAAGPERPVAPVTARAPEDGALPIGAPSAYTRIEASASEPSQRLYLTADLRAAAGLARTAMDFYLRAGVIRPTARTESGYLLFDESELATLREVIVWRTRGISLKDIKARLGRSS